MPMGSGVTRPPVRVEQKLQTIKRSSPARPRVPGIAFITWRKANAEANFGINLNAFKPLIPFVVALAAAANCVATAGATTNITVVWDGEQAVVGSGWTSTTGSGTVSLRPQTAVTHSGKTALELHCKGNLWLGAGWDWVAFAKGEGTDVRAMKRLTFWVKCTEKSGDLEINLLCGGQKLDTPEHHTAKVQLRKYCPTLGDGNWHKVAIPLADMGTPSGFDPTKVCELQMGMYSPQPVDCSFFIEDIAFDDAK